MSDSGLREMQKRGEQFRFYILAFLFVYTGAFFYLFSGCFVGSAVGEGVACGYLSESFVIFGAWGIFTLGFYYGGWRGGLAAGTGLVFVILLMHAFFQLRFDLLSI